MIITLQRLEATYFEGHGLRGFVKVGLESSDSKMYTFRIPDADNLTPPGWTWIRDLMRIRTEDIVAGWDDAMMRNPVVERLLVDVTSRYSGERFLLHEIPGSDAVDLIHLDPNIRAPRRLAGSELLPPPPAEYTDWQQLYVEHMEDRSAAFLILSLIGIPSANWIRFRVPDANDRTPGGWWMVEAFTGIAHERIVDGWERNGQNAPLDDTVKLLCEALQGHRVPLTAEGLPDVNRFRREVIRARFAQGHKPFVFVGRPDHTFEHARTILGDVASPYLFRTGALAGRTRGRPAIISNIAGKAGLIEMDNEHDVRNVLNAHIRFAAAGRPPKPRHPPKELIGQFQTSPAADWPHLRGIVRIPTMREDGSIITKAGYDGSAGVWYAPEFEMDPIPERPSRDEVQRAKSLILTPFLDFPFVGKSGAWEGAFACLLEQIVRPMIKGPRPIYVFEAPPEGQGTGKTLLAMVIQAIITGEKPHTTSVGRREEEIEKRITSLLREHTVFIIFDNIEGIVSSPAYAQLATSERWQARLLNTNEAPVLEQAATNCMTLNNAQLNRDMARRVVLIKLDTGLAEPNKRKDFRIKDVVSWVLEQRPAIIRACLVLARAWVLAGRPVDPDLALGSFEGWCTAVGGIVHHAGFKDLSKATEAAAQKDVSIEDHKLLIRIWLKQQPGVALPAIGLGQMAAEAGLYEGRLLAKGAPVAQGKRMATILTGVVGRTIDGWQINVYPKPHHGFKVYTLSFVGGPNAFNPAEAN